MELSDYKFRNKGFLILSKGRRGVTCCISKEDYKKYNLKGILMVSDDTYVVDFTEEEFHSFQRTKLMDRMLDEKK
jgi:hypothetical protein